MVDERSFEPRIILEDNPYANQSLSARKLIPKELGESTAQNPGIAYRC